MGELLLLLGSGYSTANSRHWSIDRVFLVETNLFGVSNNKHTNGCSKLCFRLKVSSVRSYQNKVFCKPYPKAPDDPLALTWNLGGRLYFVSKKGLTHQMCVSQQKKMLEKKIKAQEERQGLASFANPLAPAMRKVHGLNAGLLCNLNTICNAIFLNSLLQGPDLQSVF